MKLTVPVGTCPSVAVALAEPAGVVVGVPPGVGVPMVGVPVVTVPGGVGPWWAERGRSCGRSRGRSRGRSCGGRLQCRNRCRGRESRCRGQRVRRHDDWWGEGAHRCARARRIGGERRVRIALLRCWPRRCRARYWDREQRSATPAPSRRPAFSSAHSCDYASMPDSCAVSFLHTLHIRTS